MLIFLDPNSTLKKVSAAIATHLKSHDLAAELLLTEISARGAREGKDWKKNPTHSSNRTRTANPGLRN